MCTLSALNKELVGGKKTWEGRGLGRQREAAVLPRPLPVGEKRREWKEREMGTKVERLGWVGADRGRVPWRALPTEDSKTKKQNQLPRSAVLGKLLFPCVFMLISGAHTRSGVHMLPHTLPPPRASLCCPPASALRW